MARRPSSIDRLPKEVREKIGELRSSGRTIDEIMAKLAELNVDVSRTALGRHVKKLGVVADRALRSRHMAEALASKLRDAPENEVVQLNIELMHGILFEMVSGGEDGEAVTYDPKQLRELSGTLRDLTVAEKTSVERFIKATEAAEKAAEKRAREEAAKTLDAATKAAVAAGEKGLSEERLAQLRRDFLGVRDAA